MNLEQEVRELKALVNQLIKSDRYVFARDIQMQDGRSIQTGRANGLTIARSALEKIGFHGAIPVVQHFSTGEVQTTGGLGIPITGTGTFNGGLGGTAYTIGDIARALKNIGILAP